jgi:hypothetical protein
MYFAGSRLPGETPAPFRSALSLRLRAADPIRKNSLFLFPWKRLPGCLF